MSTVAPLVLQPVTLREACAFIEEHHRHHEPPRGCLFCVGVAAHDVVVGIAVVGTKLCSLTGARVVEGGDSDSLPAVST